MSVPKYAFQVEVYHTTGSLFGNAQRRVHNYETLDGAYAFSAMMLRKASVIRVRVLMVLDERKAMHGKIDTAFE